MVVQELRSHDLTQKAMSFNDAAIVYIKRSDCRIQFWYMSKDDAISIMNNSYLVDKKKHFVILLLCIKNEWFHLLSEKRDVILNRAKNYYENDKERSREYARDKFRNLSEEEQNKKREYGKNRYRNMSEEKKQTLRDQKNYREAKKVSI